MSDTQTLNVLLLGRRLQPDVADGAVVGLVVRLGEFEMDNPTCGPAIGEAVERALTAHLDLLQIPHQGDDPEAAGMIDMMVFPADRPLGPLEPDSVQALDL